MNALGGFGVASFALLMFPSRQVTWLLKIRYGLGFAAARRAMTIAGLGSGKPVISELP
jgi:hypothetical protein